MGSLTGDGNHTGDRLSPEAARLLTEATAAAVRIQNGHKGPAAEPWRARAARQEADALLASQIDLDDQHRQGLISDEVYEALRVDVDLSEEITPRFTGTNGKAVGRVPWRTARSVPAEKVGWLWYPRIPLGKLTLIAGDPGVGKGFLTAAIAAAATSLIEVPDGGCLRRGSVLWASFEDGAADTLRPRLENQGADLDRVLLLDQWSDEHGKPRSMRPDDVPELGRYLDEAAPDAHLLVIDPVGSFVGSGVDTYRDNEVRGVLQPLVDLADRHKIAVLVVAHLNKADLMKAIYRVAGSIGFVGLARSVLAVGKDEESGRRGVAHGKTNLGPEAVTIEYRIVPGARWDDTATLEWVGVAPDLSKEALLGSAPKRPGPDPEQREEVKAALADLLAAGPRPASDCWAFAESQRFAEATVKRAKKELGVVTYQAKGETGSKGSPGWHWSLP